VCEIAQAPRPPQRFAGVLEIEEHRSALVHHDISVVKISVDKAPRVELGDARPKQGQKTAALLSGRAKGVP
jgi:hypothetical protein